MSRALVSRLKGKVLLPPVPIQRSWIHQRQQQQQRAPGKEELLERLQKCKLACKKLWMTSLDTVLSSSKSFAPIKITVGSNSNRSKVLASTSTLLALQMPRTRRRHRSRSHSRSHTPASPQYDHKRRRVDYESPPRKGTYSGERVLRSRQHERGTSQERRYKRSHRRSPSSGRQQHSTHAGQLRGERERERDRDRERERDKPDKQSAQTGGLTSSSKYSSSSNSAKLAAVQAAQAGSAQAAATAAYSPKRESNRHKPTSNKSQG